MHRIAGSLGALVLVACGGGGDRVDLDACDDLRAGPFAPLGAGTTMDDRTPIIDAAGPVYRVTLPAGRTGFLAFDPPAAGAYAVFTSRAVPVAAYNPAGAELVPTDVSSASAACAEIHGRYIIPLPAARSYFGVGPDPVGPVDVVLRRYDVD